MLAVSDVVGGIARVPTVAVARPFDDGGAARPDVDGGIARVPTVAVARPLDDGGAARLAIQLSLLHDPNNARGKFFFVRFFSNQNVYFDGSVSQIFKSTGTVLYTIALNPRVWVPTSI